MTTKELIEALQKADPTGDRLVMIYVDSSAATSFHPFAPHLVEHTEDGVFESHVMLSTGGIWDPEK